VLNPATGEVLQQVSQASGAQVRQAIRGAPGISRMVKACAS
jgi:acyl-CoA reductase-like NAD-dependent aldehyde dehydrogenase